MNLGKLNLDKENNMRKLILFTLAFGIAGLAHAGVFGAQEKSNFEIHYVLAGDITVISTATILIDLSDTSNFPHKQTTSIDISYLKITVEKVRASSGTIKVGVVTRVDATNADVSFFASVIFATTTATRIEKELAISPSTIRTRIKNGAPLFFVTNDSSTSDTLFQTDFPLATGAGGLATPEVGDIVVKTVARNTEEATYTITAFYQGVRR